MERKQITEIICGILLVSTIMSALIDYRMALVYIGEPFIIPAITWMVAEEYCSAIDVPYHYMGSKMLDTEQVAGAEWTRAFMVDYGWAFDKFNYGV